MAVNTAQGASQHPDTRPISRHLLPDTASINSEGHLIVGGVNVAELATEFGTPLFVYDETHMRSRCREAVEAFGPGVAYASKAFLCQAMAQLAFEEGMHLDVATAGELHVSLSAGVPGDRCVLHGNNKSYEELAFAVSSGISRVVIDSFDEIDRIERLHRETGRVVNALIRVTPGVEAHTHEYISTGQDDSKFGFTASTGLAEAAVRRAQASSAIHLAGIHAHIGSQVFRVESFREAATVMAQMTRRFGLSELSVGGGLGVAYVAAERAPTISQWGRAVLDACRKAGVEARVTAEPGRSIVAAAGITVYTIGTIKALEGVRTYVSVDGGMSDNPRPVLYGSGYEAFVATKAGAERPRRVRVVGKHCESGDIVVREAQLPEDVAVEDLLVTPVTGAYGYALASNYNKVARPAVAFVRDGAAKLVLRRETFDDLTRLDAIGATV